MRSILPVRWLVVDHYPLPAFVSVMRQKRDRWRDLIVRHPERKMAARWDLHPSASDVAARLDYKYRSVACFALSRIVLVQHNQVSLAQPYHVAFLA